MTAPVVDEKALKSCPFCGEQAIYVHQKRNMPKGWISCCNCNASTDTAEQWNTRAVAPQPDLQKLIAQMEGMKCAALNHEHDGHIAHNRAIDRCIALVRKGVDHG